MLRLLVNKSNQQLLPYSQATTAIRATTTTPATTTTAIRATAKTTTTTQQLPVARAELDGSRPQLEI